MKKNILALLCLLTAYSTQAQFYDFSDPVRLGGTINSDAEESMPIFSSDSSRLYFVRTFDRENRGDANDQDIWVSERENGEEYSSCSRIKELNNKLNNAILGLSSDGRRMYLIDSYEGKRDMVKGIAVSTYEDGKWGAPEHIEIPGLDIEGAAYGFHVSEDETTIIISYEGEGSLGEEDLYVCTKSSTGWSAPVHMGSEINSPGYEISPFLSSSKDTLYFSSNGFVGQGDCDIYYAVRKEGDWTKWSAPVNLGSRINSPKFDAYFVTSGAKAYWSSNREGELADIYEIDIIPPPPLVALCAPRDVSVYKGNDGRVDVIVDSGVAPYSYSWSNGEATKDLSGLAKGEYVLTLKDAVGQELELICIVDEPAKPIEPVIVSEYETLQFKHIFGYNKNKLSVNRGELRKFVKEVGDQIKDGREHITINVYSSASRVPTATYGTNQRLADVRAENMKYDLVSFFDKKRKFKGKVTVTIVEAKVGGPEYEEDAANQEKYTPFQYVSLETE